MFLIPGALLLAIFVLPTPWGMVLVLTSVVLEVAEKAFWLRWTKRRRPVVGPEALLGLPAEVLTACQPDGAVRLGGERWRAHCSEGAGVGDTVVVEALEQLTLFVSQPASAFDRHRATQ